VDRENVAGVDLGAAALVADRDYFAFDIGHRLDVGFFARHDLNGLREEGGDDAQALQGTTLEGPAAVVGLVGDIVLDEGRFRITAGNQVAV